MDFCCQRVEEDRSHNNIKSCLRFRLAGLFDLVTTKRDQETAVDFEPEIIRESREEAFVWSDLVSQLKSHLPTFTITLSHFHFHNFTFTLSQFHFH